MAAGAWGGDGFVATIGSSSMTKHAFTHSPIQFQITKDECAFQSVLDVFATATRITIVTYNVTEKSTALFEALRTTKARVVLISNIPGRSHSYFGSQADKWKDTAKKQITQYMTLLDPNYLGGNVETWFCFSNHAKIILTDTIGFVGSANFSVASSKNWETGVIVRDAATIAQLESLVNEIKADSVRFLGNVNVDFLRPLALLTQCWKTAQDKLTEACLDELGLALHELSQAIGSSDVLWGECEEEGGPITSHIEMQLITDLENLIDSSSMLREYAEFDPERMDVGDFPSDAYGDKLEMYFESASQDNSDRLEELEEAAKEDLSVLKVMLSRLCEQVESVVSIINTAKAIDNTQGT
jgi:hypothetical protein